MVLLLASPSNFTADMLIRVDSGPAQLISFASMDKTIDSDGLFTFFRVETTDTRFQNTTHSILIQENPLDSDATWNLVAVE